MSSEEIVAKVIDGEAIIINLSNGYYYSTVGTGATVWARIEAGHTAQDIIQAVAAQSGHDPAVVARDVDAFLAELEQEGLIGRLKDGATGAPSPDDVPPVAAPYSPPTLSRFEDMAHFFALDPPLPDLDDPSSTPVEL